MVREKKIFSPTSEKDVTRAIIRAFAAQLDEYTESDAVIVGGGPSGLLCGKILAEAGKKVLIVEKNNYLGGGFWIGGYLMNVATVRSPANNVFDELGIPYQMASEGLYTVDAPHACSKLIAAACDAGVKFLNMTMVEDVVVRKNNRVEGLVINWTAVKSLPRAISCVDPVSIEARVVIDATGHDASVAVMLENQGLFETAGTGAMWIEDSEDAIVERTGEVYPGLVAIGMAVSTVFGLPRMGPTFGGMLLSGQRGAECALSILDKKE